MQLTILKHISELHRTSKNYNAKTVLEYFRIHRLRRVVHEIPSSWKNYASKIVLEYLQIHHSRYAVLEIASS